MRERIDGQGSSTPVAPRGGPGAKTKTKDSQPTKYKAPTPTPHPPPIVRPTPEEIAEVEKAAEKFLAECEALFDFFNNKSNFFDRGDLPC